jgi:hypothetical protein
MVDWKVWMMDFYQVFEMEYKMVDLLVKISVALTVAVKA